MEIEEITQNEKQYVIFYLGNKKFGVNIKESKEILSNTDLTFVPDSPDYISGIINLRGSVVPVVDLKKRLNINTAKKGSEQKIIIIELPELTAGMLVDDVKEIKALEVEDIVDLPDLAKNINRDYIEGVGRVGEDNELLILLDLKNILTAQEIEELKNVDKK